MPANVAGMIRRRGELIVLRRWAGTDPRAPHDVHVRGTVTDYRPDELAGQVDQANRFLRITDAEIRRYHWPGPPAKGDDVELAGRIYEVLAARSRRLGARETIHFLAIKG